jgi:hypothetical protein
MAKLPPFAISSSLNTSQLILIGSPKIPNGPKKIEVLSNDPFNQTKLSYLVVESFGKLFLALF